MSVLPNFPARVDTVTQIMMGSPVPACCMSSARGRQSTCPHQRRWESYVTTLSLTEPAKRAAIQAAEHRLQHAMRQRGEAELDLYGSAMHEREPLFQKKRRGKTRQLMGVKLMNKARQRRLHQAETPRRETERKAAKAREKAAQQQRGLRRAQRDLKVPHRANQIRATVPKVFEHALAAQRRDVIRYRKVRRGDVQPRTHRFEVGAYVYCAQPPINTLDMKTTAPFCAWPTCTPPGGST